VVGAGQMGTGIAKVAITQAKRSVILMDTNTKALGQAKEMIDFLFSKDVGKGKISQEDSDAAKSRLVFSQDYAPFSEADFIIEAASENPSLKASIFSSLDKICKPDAILASNTSSISITRIASSTQRPDKVIGMHFMNPVPVMKLVEIIPGIATSAETLTQTKDLAAAMGKVTTESRDVAGFIANRLLCPYLNEAIQALYEGLGTVDDINNTLLLGCNMPMGPLTLADFIGLDTVLAIMQVLHAELGDRYKPSPLLVRYVEAGWLGKKSGRGFLVYDQTKK